MMFQFSYENPLFMSFMIVAAGIHLRITPRREHFIWRFFITLIFLLGVSFAIPSADETLLAGKFYMTGIRILQFGMLLCGSIFCFKEKFTYLLTRSVFGFLSMYIAHVIAVSFVLILNIDIPWLTWLVHIGSALITLSVFLFFSLRQEKGIYQSYSGNLSAYFFIGLIVVVLSFFQTTYEDSPLWFLIPSIMIIAYLSFILLNIYADERRLKIEYEMMKTLRQKEKEQYRISKELIDTINLKCHDMKHQIHNLRENNATISAEVLDAMENTVNEYDAGFVTGNKPLDIILTEKNRYCRDHKISIACIAEGKILDFIKEEDIYSLFGNILDNAIQAIKKIPEDKRTITLSVRKESGAIYIRCENYYEGKIRFNNDLPLTTKKDAAFHGFGTKSIKNITTKYNGAVYFDAHEGTFTVNIIIPYLAK